MEQLNGAIGQAAAFAHVRRGWHVLPLRKGSKLPATTNGFKDATTDSQQVAEWWDMWPEANVGIATGASGLLVIDVDTKGGKVGAQSLINLEKENGKLPETYTVRTWSGGWQMYFQMPQERLGCTRGEAGKYLGADIDTRGDGGYVVAAGSRVEEDGKSGDYVVINDAAPAVLPSWVSEKLKKPERSYPVLSGDLPDAFQGTPATLAAYVERRCAEIRNEPVGGRGEPWVNGIAVELSRYVPHQLNERDLRFALESAVAAWTDHPEAGLLGIEHGMRHIGTAEHEKRRWTEARPFTPGPQGPSPVGDLLPSPDDPMAVARALMSGWTFEGEHTLRHWNGGWVRWVGTHWVEEDTNALRASIYPALEHAAYEKDGKAVPWHPNRRRVGDLVEAMEAVGHLHRGVQAPSFMPCAGLVQGAVQGAVQGPKVPLTCTVQSVQSKTPPIVGLENVVACANGLLDVATRTLHPHTPLFFNLVSVPFDYEAQAPSPARWLSFLESIWGADPASIDALQEWFGYVLSGRTDLEKILYVQGPTRSGKGTIERVLTALIGESNRAPITAAKLATDFGLASLIGKSLAVMSDARMPKENSEVVLERLLSISGGDPLPVSRKFREDWMGAIPARLMLMSNNLPDFKDPSGALTGRLVILSMTESFLGREDGSLKSSLAKEMPGILNWALDGLHRLTQRGFMTEPGSSATARSIAEESSSPLRTLIEETFVKGDDKVIAKSDLYDIYAASAGAFAMKSPRFFKELYESGIRFTEYRSKRGLFGGTKQTPMWRGIGIEGGCAICGRSMNPYDALQTGHPNCAVE